MATPAQLRHSLIFPFVSSTNTAYGGVFVYLVDRVGDRAKERTQGDFEADNRHELPQPYTP